MQTEHKNEESLMGGESRGADGVKLSGNVATAVQRGLVLLETYKLISVRLAILRELSSRILLRGGPLSVPVNSRLGVW